MTAVDTVPAGIPATAAMPARSPLAAAIEDGARALDLLERLGIPLTARPVEHEVFTATPAHLRLLVPHGSDWTYLAWPEPRGADRDVVPGPAPEPAALPSWDEALYGDLVVRPYVAAAAPSLTDELLGGAR